MALSLSQGLVERQVGAIHAQRTSTGLSVILGASWDQIGDAASLFVASGLETGWWAELHGFANSGNNVRAPVIDVTASRLKLPTGYVASDESAGASVSIYQVEPGDLRTLTFNSQLDLYGSPRPSNADASEGAATRLAVFTGIKTRGPYYDSTNDRAYFELYGDALSVTPLATGVAVWFRWRLAGVTTMGPSTTAPRVDGSAGVGATYDLKLALVDIDPEYNESLAGTRLYCHQA